MAKIKIFKGAGPNQNVPFSVLGQSRFAGQTGDAVTKLVNDFGNRANQYAEFQKKQTDVADEVNMAGEKQKFLSSLRADSLQEDGTYDVASMNDRLNEFDGFAKESMSKEAYANYSLKESQKNAHIIATSQNENLKTTRNNNLNSLSSGAKELMRRASAGTFEEMMMGKNETSEFVAQGVASGMLTTSQSEKFLEKTFSETAKDVLDNLSTPTSKNPLDVSSTFDRAAMFIEVDPLGVFTKDPLLKQQALIDLGRKRLTAESQALAKEQSDEFRQDRATKQMQKQNFKNKYAEYNTFLALPDTDPTKEEKMLAMQIAITKDIDIEGLTDIQAENLLRLPQRRIKQDSIVLSAQIMNDPVKNAFLIDSIDDPQEKAKAERFLTVLPNDLARAYAVNKTLTGAGKVGLAQSLRADYDAFSSLKPSEDKFNKEDLEALYTVYPMNIDPTNPDKKVHSTLDTKLIMNSNTYNNSVNKRIPLTGNAEIIARLGRLRNILNTRIEEMKSERASKEPVDGR